MATTRAFEAFGPPHPKQLLLTGLFGTELFLKTLIALAPKR
jgi:hypothetical protein